MTGELVLFSALVLNGEKQKRTIHTKMFYQAKRNINASNTSENMFRNASVRGEQQMGVLVIAT